MPKKTPREGEKRDPATGRLLPGHKPPKSPGRPKAGGNRAVRKTANRKALDIIEGLLGKAHKAIDDALTERGRVIVTDEEGRPVTMSGHTEENPKYKTMPAIPADPKVAMWLIDRLIPKDDTTLPKEMEVELSTMDGVIEAAETTVQWVAARQLTIDKGEKMLRLLLTYAQMRAFDHIDELRKLIAEFEKQSAGGITKMDEKLVPQWGRLADNTQKAASE